MGGRLHAPAALRTMEAMCELFAMSACTPVRVRYDLDRFAAEGGERHQNRDGWGAVFSDGRDAYCFREPVPASDSPLGRFVRAHAAPHTLALAHVRRSSLGARSLANTHPFRRVRRGRVQHFAHNGTLHGLHALPEAAPLAPECVGETDSELAFMLLLARLERQAPDGADRLARLRVFQAFSRDMAALGPANFIWLDGDTLFVHADRRRHETEHGLSEPRAPGLHMMRSEAHALRGPHDCVGAAIEEMCEHMVLFASVPLSEGPWQPLPQGRVLAVADGRLLQPPDRE